MKKIMFNDKYGLTQAVLEGRKTMTRRVCKGEIPLGNWAETEKYAPYQVGDVVAIAQCYYNVYGYETCISERGEKDAGIFNKMFVRAKSMPHHIKIMNIRIERLQDISDEDCIKEGVKRLSADTFGIKEYARVPILKIFFSQREAFAALIDKVSGNGTWDSNPLVWVYEFELVD